MTTIVCGWCTDKCNMTVVGRPIVNQLPYFGGEDKYIADAAYTCDGCRRMSVVTWTTSYDPTDSRWQEYGRAGGPEDYEDAQWSPAPGHQKNFPDVTREIADAASEAWTCHVVGATRGAAALARAVVEATAKAKGIKTGTLEAKIDALADQGLIRGAVRDQAHEIRHLGNDAAHGDLTAAVPVEESEEVLTLMGEVLNEVFQAPKRAERMAEARAARKAQGCK